MKKAIYFFTLTLLFGAVTSCTKVPNTGAIELKTNLDSLSYALGYIEANSTIEKFETLAFDSISRVEMGIILEKTNLTDRFITFRHNQFDTLDIDMFKRGFLNKFVYDRSYFSEGAASMFARAEYKKATAKRDSIKKIELEANKTAGAEFLAKNGKRDGVVTTESGLQYEIIKEGTGKTPIAKDKIECIYHGTHIDGTVFDSSKDRGDIFKTRVDGVIKGWQEAMKLMPQGSIWKIYVPSNLAYGERGSKPKIAPGETLIFEVELTKIK